MSEFSNPFSTARELETQRRWRLILGKEASEEEQGQQGQASPDDYEEGQGEAGEGEGKNLLSEEDQMMDDTLDALYGEGDLGGDNDSAPDIARWLGDIHEYFPSPVAQLMQQDALKKLRLQKLLADPEALAKIEPDLYLATKILALKKIMPEKTNDTARQVVRKVVEELKEKLEYPLLQALQGASIAPLEREDLASLKTSIGCTRLKRTSNIINLRNAR